MDKKQNILLVFIILLIIIITVIAIMLAKNNNSNTNNANINNSDQQYMEGFENYIDTSKDEYNIEENGLLEEGEEIIYTYNYKLEHVTDRNKYFTIKAIFDNYITRLENGSYKYVLNILSPQCKKEYNINAENIVEILKIQQSNNPMQYYVANIQEMLYTEIDFYTYVYIIKAKYRLWGQEETFDISVMIEVDETNRVYNIYPEKYIKDKGLDTLTQGDTLNYTKEEINDRENNNYKFVTKTDVEMANEYFNHYQELINYYPDIAFDKLDVEYMQKRFGNKENFLKHLEENKSVLSYMKIDKYKVYSGEGYADYICTDKHDNVYMFRQKGGVMRYTVFLDNYTVMHEQEKATYNEMDIETKARYNIRKFMNMVNTKDYNAIYNTLDTTFRENNFKTIDDLKLYIKNNMYNLNDIKIIDSDTEKYKYYVYNYKIINSENEQQSKEMTIIINQTEGAEYTMSFSFKEQTNTEL